MDDEDAGMASQSWAILGGRTEGKIEGTYVLGVAHDRMAVEHFWAAKLTVWR